MTKTAFITLKIRIYYSILFLAMFPWVQMHYHVFRGALDEGAWYLFYESVEYALPYVILIYVILKSRLLAFWLAGILVVQRVMETVLFVLQGKFVLGASNVIFLSLWLFPKDQIIDLVRANMYTIISVVVILSVSILVYVRMIIALYRYYKTLSQPHKVKLKTKRLYRPMIRETICILLVILAFQQRSHSERFFFEPTGNNFLLQPIYVEKSAPISIAEGVPFDIDVYYVRGEATTPEHMSLYGYHRDTTPFLNSIKSQLSIFENAVSPSGGSASSDALMFSSGYKIPDNDFFRTPHLLEELAHNKIPVMYIGYRRDFDRYQNYVYDSLINSAEKSYFALEQYPYEIFLSNLDILHTKILLKYANPYPTFYFFHTAGSHVSWYDRPLPNGVIRYADTKSNNKQQQDIDHYDDSIRYTDWFLQELYQVAETRKQQTGRDYVIWYTSDHSYVLYRDGSKWQSYNLDNESIIGRDVPFFILNKQHLPCFNRLPSMQRNDFLNTTQTFYWVLGALCLYNGDELNINPPLLPD